MYTGDIEEVCEVFNLKPEIIDTINDFIMGLGASHGQHYVAEDVNLIKEEFKDKHEYEYALFAYGSVTGQAQIINRILVLDEGVKQ